MQIIDTHEQVLDGAFVVEHMSSHGQPLLAGSLHFKYRVNLIRIKATA
jgi:hypothetical protein